VNSAQRRRRRVFFDSPLIDKKAIYERHNWTCIICGSEIDKNLALPNDLAPTLDHLIPLSRGGSHSEDNLAPAHAICNFLKADRTLEEISGEC
jgi:5-methylcytosine-specific restriction endonuclease McrA